MWVKTTCCNMSLSSFNLETSFTMILYWCSPLPVRRLQPAESYNSLSFSSLLLEGSYNPLLLFIKHQMINKYITVTVHYRYQISNNRTNPEHLINREIQSTEHFKTETQFFLLWPATRRSKPSSPLRPHADILLLRCVPHTVPLTALRSIASGMHPETLSRCVFCYRVAPKNTIAPHPFASETHLNLDRSASPRRSLVTERRPRHT